MTQSAPNLNPTEAARRLGVSVKALRVYEERGLLAPPRTASGWRAYGAADMERAGAIVTLRTLGLSLAQITQVLGGDAGCLAQALRTHLAALDARAGEIAHTIDRLRRMLSETEQGRVPSAADLARALRPGNAAAVAFELPWPWGGERFELTDLRPLTFITGPMLSGKTRLARAIAANLPGCRFVGLDRLEETGADASPPPEPSPAERVAAATDWLLEDGAVASPALAVLVAILEDQGSRPLVIDMVEQGLDRATQEAVMAWLRRRAAGSGPLFLMTRSTAILDLDAAAAGDAILFCPANHSPPMLVAPYPGARGYEAVASCLAPPDVRARTEGFAAVRATGPVPDSSASFVSAG